MTVILGIKSENRCESANSIQKILTEYGCYIRTRLGLHDTTSFKCPKEAIMLLEITDKKMSVEIEKKLLNISSIEIQRMEFDLN